MGIIYIATNKINGVYYIGKTSRTIDERRKEHEYCSIIPTTYFHRAIHKYSCNNFSWKILDKSDSEQELSELEQYYIHLFCSCEHDIGYNSTIGGEGVKRSYLTGLKITLSKLGKKLSQGTIEKIKNTKRSRVYPKIIRGPMPEETKEKISRTKRKITALVRALGEFHHSDEIRKQISDKKKGKTSWMKDRHHTLETIRKISEAKKGSVSFNKGMKMSEEQIKKMVASKLGKPIHRTDTSYKTNCIVCKEVIFSRSNTTKYCDHCKDLFSGAELRKIRASVESGEEVPIWAEIIFHTTPKGEGTCSIQCKICKNVFKAINSGYRICPECKEKRDREKLASKYKPCFLCGESMLMTSVNRRFCDSCKKKYNEYELTAKYKLLTNNSL